jgi:hydrogenase maturation protease
MPHSDRVRCLILACGNTLRGDDGVGPWLAQWAEERFRAEAEVKIVSRQQWTPELAEDIARADFAIFIDCSAASAPGSIELCEVKPALHGFAMDTHHLGAPELLALGRELFGAGPQSATLLTIGAASTELGEKFSEPVKAALPEACGILEEAVVRAISRVSGLRHSAS